MTLNIFLMSNEKLKIISLFSGAGGLDIGFDAAGFETAVAVEIDPSCCDTLRTNRPDIHVINKSVTEVTGEELLEAGGMKMGEPALVIGGPPCQSFSLAGLRKGLDDDRGKLLFEYVRLVRETLPKGFVLENVRGLANWDHGRALQLLEEELSKPINVGDEVFQYEITKPQILNAVDYGAPQERERLIMVGNRIGKSFQYPAPQIFEKPQTVWNAIGDLPEPEPPSEVAQRVSGTIKERREKYGF